MSKNVSQTPVEKQNEGANSLEFFSMVPHSVIRDTRLSLCARVLYGTLDGRIGQKGGQRVTRKLLASDLGVSVGSIKRALNELVEAGLLIRHTTGRSNLYELKNPSRRKGEPQDGSYVSHPQIDNSLINNQNNNQPEQALGVGVGAVEEKGNFEQIVLKAIAAECGVLLQGNTKTKEHCSRADRLGHNPHEFGIRVAEYFLGEKSRKSIRSDSGFLVGVCFKAILEGDNPKDILKITPTPVPPKFNSQEIITCEHGGESGLLSNGLPRCPLCRAIKSKEETLFQELERVI